MEKELEVIRFLLDEIERESIALKEYADVDKKCRSEAKAFTKNGFEYIDIYYKTLNKMWGMPIPRKSVINDNIKKIRKICLGMYQ